MRISGDAARCDFERSDWIAEHVERDQAPLGPIDPTESPPCASYPAWTTCRGPACTSPCAAEGCGLTMENRYVDAGTCKNAWNRFGGDQGCDGAACCRPGSVLGARVDVTAYLDRARPGWDDARAVSEAIECASSLPSSASGAVVFFPAGVYSLRTPIRPAPASSFTPSGRDASKGSLTLEGPRYCGGTDDAGVAVLRVDPCNPAQEPGAIRIRGEHLSNLAIRNLRIDLTDGPRLSPTDPRASSNSAIQLNSCRNCTVENVVVRYVGPEEPQCKPYNLDGITFAASYGTIRNVVVEGIPKAGIYFCDNYDQQPELEGAHRTTLANAEVRRCDGPLGAVGIAIAKSNVDVTSVYSHDNRQHPVEGGRSSFSAGLRTYEVPWEGGYGIHVGNQRGRPHSPPVPYPSDVQIDRAVLSRNGIGMWVGIQVKDTIPTRISFRRSTVTGNLSHGFALAGGSTIALDGLLVRGNGLYGIYVYGAGPVLGHGLRASVGEHGVTISGSTLCDNGMRSDLARDHVGVAAIQIVSADQVLVRGTTIVRTMERSNQRWGLRAVGEPKSGYLFERNVYAGMVAGEVSTLTSSDPSFFDRWVAPAGNRYSNYPMDTPARPLDPRNP